MSLARLGRLASTAATFHASGLRLRSAPVARLAWKRHARTFAAKAARKPQLLAQFVEHGTSFDLHGPRQELYHPREASMTRALFSEPGDFVAAAADMAECEELNPLGIPEIAFVGKSNVGKSSLLNALMRTSIVNTSKQPGRTKGLNFFGVGPSIDNSASDPGADGGRRIDPSTRALRLVDLPGYGYARVSKDTVQDLHRRVYDYLFTRDRSILMHVFILVDVRRGQPSDSDLELMRAMDREGVRYRVVLTKMDTVTSDDALKQAVVNTMHLTLKNLACDPFVSVVSSKFGVGVEELRRCIGQLVAEREIVADTMMQNMAAQQNAVQNGDGHWH